MSSFTSQLVVSPLSDGRNWRLVKSFTYHIGTKFSRHYIRVPKGFVTDFASVPRVTSPLVTIGALLLLFTHHVWPTIIILSVLSILSWFSPYGRHGKPAVIHDWLYHTKEIMGKPITRKRADDIYREASQIMHTEKWRVFMEYWALRLGGWMAWHRKSRDNAMYEDWR